MIISRDVKKCIEDRNGAALSGLGSADPSEKDIGVISLKKKILASSLIENTFWKTSLPYH
jgi:hypothetical protein